MDTPQWGVNYCLVLSELSPLKRKSFFYLTNLANSQLLRLPIKDSILDSIHFSDLVHIEGARPLICGRMRF